MVRYPFVLALVSLDRKFNRGSLDRSKVNLARIVGSSSFLVLVMRIGKSEVHHSNSLLIGNSLSRLREDDLVSRRYGNRDRRC